MFMWSLVGTNINTAQLLYPQGKGPSTHCTGGSVSPKAGMDTEAKRILNMTDM